MRLRQVILMVTSRLLRGLGMGVSASGLCCTAWFLFFSSSDVRFYYIGIGLVMMVAGYAVYTIALRYIYNEYS